MTALSFWGRSAVSKYLYYYTGFSIITLDVELPGGIQLLSWRRQQGQVPHLLLVSLLIIIIIIIIVIIILLASSLSS